MSLLLDALKRAAQEKLEKQRQNETGAVDSPDALSLDIAEGENEVQRTHGAQESSDGDNAADEDLRMHRADVLASELQAFMGRTNTEYTMEHHDPDLELEPAPPEPEERKTGSVSFVTRPASASTPAAAGRMFANKRANGIR